MPEGTRALAACLALAMGTPAMARPICASSAGTPSTPHAVGQESGASEASGVPELRASWGPTRLEAEVGEPVPWALEIAHPRRARPTVVSQDLADQLDRSWVLVSGPQVRTRDDGPQTAITTFTWILMALEPGDRVAPALTLATGSGAELDVPSAVLAVRPALGPDEDAPRPLASFHEVDPDARLSGLAFAALVVALLGLLAAPFVLRYLRLRRRRRPAGSELVLAPREAFEALVAGRSDEPESVRAMAFELIAILRRALVAGEPGDTDEEWLEAVRSRAREDAASAGALNPSLVERAADVVRACQEIKYGGRIPTRFAVDELLASARAILDGLHAPMDPARDSAREAVA